MNEDIVIPHPKSVKYDMIIYLHAVGNPTRATSRWVGEKKWYKYSKKKSCNPPPGESCGHYTQVPFHVIEQLRVN